MMQRLVLPIFALIMLMIAIFFALHQTRLGPSNPILAVPQSPFKNTVAGNGIVEPQTGVIQIGTALPGIITHIYVELGQKVKIGDPLFKIDDSEFRSELKLAKVKLDAAKSELADTRKQNISHSAEHLAQAKLNDANANLELILNRMNKLTVKSPINGTVLKINNHLGEMVAGNANPVMLLGHLENSMRVRVEIDETDVFRFTPQSQAVGLMKGDASHPIVLKFVKEEPLITSKKIITGSSSEIVDTRVLQILYTFDNSKIDAHVGQQMDVFIQANENSNQHEVNKL